MAEGKSILAYIEQSDYCIFIHSIDKWCDGIHSIVENQIGIIIILTSL